MATSTASSPSFLAGFTGAPSSSRRVWESSGLAFRRALMVAASRVRISLLMIWLIHCREQSGNRLGPEIPAKHTRRPTYLTRGLLIKAYRQARSGHEALGLADRMLAVVEDRSGQHR